MIVSGNNCENCNNGEKKNLIMEGSGKNGVKW